jgi:hypothetical protein
MLTGWPEPLVTDRDEGMLGPDMLGLGGHAVFNEARTHRYLLCRRWSDGPVMTWIMLNPSTADAFADDPTIRRCISFARREGCGGLRVVNLFALRATNPRELRKHPDPVGPCADQMIDAQAGGAYTVAAWGADATAIRRGRQVGRRLIAAGVSLSCLGVTSAGHPRHPLYVRSSALLTPWTPPAVTT